MRWNIVLECIGEDGKRSKITLGTIDRLTGSTTAENLGVNLQESKQIVNRLQDTIVKQQLQEHCEQRRICITCGRLRPLKGYRRRRLDTVLGTVQGPVQDPRRLSVGTAGDGPTDFRREAVPRSCLPDPVRSSAD